MKSEEHIIEIVSYHLNISIDEMKGTTRARPVVDARQLVCYLCRSCLPLSYREIGKLLHRDHATVIYSVKAIENRISIYPKEKIVVDKFMDIVNDHITAITLGRTTKSETIFQENDYYN